MIVAMVSMWMVQVAFHQVIDMVSMRNRLVAATWTMNVTRLMAAAAMTRGAALWVGCGYLNHVLAHFFSVRMMKATVVKIIDVITVTDSRMTAVRTMLMGMVLRRG
jgi:hypothetical protein